MFQVQRKCKNKELRQTVLKVKKTPKQTHHHTEMQETTDTSLSPPPFQLFPLDNSRGADFALRIFYTSSKRCCGFHPCTRASLQFLLFSCFWYLQNFRSQIISCKFFSPPSNSFTPTMHYLLNRNSFRRCIQLCNALVNI